MRSLKSCLSMFLCVLILVGSFAIVPVSANEKTSSSESDTVTDSTVTETQPSIQKSSDSFVQQNTESVSEYKATEASNKVVTDSNSNKKTPKTKITKKGKASTGASSPKQIVSPAGEYYTRGEWLHNLNAIFNFTVENEEDMPDNYFRDLKKTDTYYEDILLAVEFGVVECEAGEEVHPDDFATRDFAASTLNFCLGYKLSDETYTFTDVDDVTHPVDAQIAVNRSWFALSDGKFNPSANVTSAEGSAMFEDAQTTLNNSKVDDNYDNNFDFADSVIVVPKETAVSIDEDNTVEINGYTGEIKSGDKFAVFVNDIPSCYKAKTVTKNGSVLIITTENAELEDVVNDADAQGSAEVLDDYFEVADGVEVIDEELEDVSSANLNSYSTSGKAKLPTGASGNKKIKSKTLSVPFSLGKVKCNIKVKLTNLSMEYNVKALSGYYMVKFNGDADVTATAKISDIIGALGGSTSIDLCTLRAPGIGSCGFTLNFSVSGKITLNYKTGFTIGAERSRSGGMRAIKNFNKKAFTVTIEVEAKICLRAGADINVLGVIKGSAYSEMGVKIIYQSTDYVDGKTPKNCTTIRAWFYAEMGAYMNIGIGAYSNTLFGIVEDYINEYNSPYRIYYHYEDGGMVTQCSRSGKKYYTTPYDSSHGWSSYGNGTYGYDTNGKQVKIYDYTIEDGNATITKYYGKAKYLNIPDSLNGYSVVKIGSQSFRNNKIIQSVIIPDSIRVIDFYAFANCSNLENVQLSKTLETLGQGVFGATSINSIEIPKSLNKASCYPQQEYTLNGKTYTIQDGPFYNCEKLKQITYENGVTAIPESLFAGCVGLEKIAIPDTVTTIGKYAFCNCLRLKVVAMGKNVNEIGSDAFSNDVSLESINLSNTLTKLGTGAFRRTNIRSINIPKSLSQCTEAYYADYCFNGNKYSLIIGPFCECDNLKTIVFENGITKIPEFTFSGCTGLEEIVIPDTVTLIDKRSFCGCLRLKTVTMGKNVNNIEYDAFSNDISLEKISLPNTLVSLGSGVFTNTKIKSINIPKKLSTCSTSYYGDYSFDGVDYKLVYGPFYKCEYLKDVQFETGTETIPDHIFSGCTGLESLMFPDSIVSIGSGAFSGCLRLNSIIFGNGINKIDSSAFSTNVSLKTISIPDSVTSMGSNVFSGCTSLKKAKLPSTRQNIMEYTFQNCSSLQEVEFTDSVIKIQQYAFDGCTSLESITFSKNLTTIGQYAFHNSGLKSIFIPEKVINLGSYAFQGSENLESISISSGLNSLSIGNNCFQNCSKLSTVNLPSRVKSLGSYAFQNCEKLSNVNFADYGIKKFDNYTFKDDSLIESIVLPKGLTTISTQIFVNCTGLKSVTIPESVTSISDDAFSYPDKITVYGKSGSYAETYCNNHEIRFIDNHILAEGIALTEKFDEYNDNFTLEVGENMEVEFELYPIDSNDCITLTSNNNNVTIDGMFIKGYSAGDSVITATTTSGADYQFNVHIKKVNSITLTSLPDKTTYINGEKFDPTGIVVTVNYNDGSSKTTTDYTISGYDASTNKVQTLTVTYTAISGSTYTKTFTVEVVDEKGHLTGIEIKKLPNKLNYVKRESLDTTGMIVVEKYDSGVEIEVTDYTVSGYNALKTGEQVITVTKGDYSTTFKINVYATAEEIPTNPTGPTEPSSSETQSTDPTSSESSTNEVETLLIGDVNKDGRINIRDVTTIQLSLANYITLDEAQTKAADVNGDKEVNINDCTMIQLYLVGLVMSLPVKLSV